MDEQFFKRACRVYVYDSGGVKTTIEGLRIAFKISAKLGKTPNTAELSIYNLSEATRSKIQKTGTRVEIEAGYASLSGTLFSGNIRHVDIVRDGADWLCKITAGDGERAYKTVLISASFSKGATVEQVLRALASEYAKAGVGQGNLDVALSTFPRTNNFRTFASGFSALGYVSDKMTQVCNTLGWQWSVQKGQLAFTYGTAGVGSTIVQLSPQSGLIGSPEHGNSDDKKKKPTVKVRSLLNPLLWPGQSVKIVSETIKGVFSVQAAAVSGDTHGKEWYSDVEVLEK